VFTWLYRIGVNEGLARRRRRRLETIHLDAAAARVSDSGLDDQPEAMSEAADTREQVLAAFTMLSFDYRVTVVLRELAGLSHEEVADALDLTLPAARSRIHRGRLRLGELLEPHSAA